VNSKVIQVLVLIASLLVGLGGWGSERFKAHGDHPMNHILEELTVSDMFSLSTTVGSVLLAWGGALAYKGRPEIDKR